MSRCAIPAAIAEEDDPKCVADEIQAHLESLGYRCPEVEIHSNHHVGNSGEEHRP